MGFKWQTYPFGCSKLLNDSNQPWRPSISFNNVIVQRFSSHSKFKTGYTWLTYPISQANKNFEITMKFNRSSHEFRIKINAVLIHILTLFVFKVNKNSEHI